MHPFLINFRANFAMSYYLLTTYGKNNNYTFEIRILANCTETIIICKRFQCKILHFDNQLLHRCMLNSVIGRSHYRQAICAYLYIIDISSAL